MIVHSHYLTPVKAVCWTLFLVFSLFGTIRAQENMPGHVSFVAAGMQQPHLQETGATQTDQKTPAQEYLDWIRYNLKEVPLLLKILYAITIGSILTMGFLLVVILLNRSRLEREAKKRAELLEQYQQWLMDYLFESGEERSAFTRLRKSAADPWNRQILIDQIMDLMVNLKGEVKDRARNLYMELGLDQDSMSKARSRKWHTRIKGFKELSFMNIQAANDQLIRSLASKNEILKMEAQIALVRLSGEHPFDWLHRLETPLPIWEQITLVELLVQHELPVPSFRQWFGSNNLSVVKFALNMVSRFGQKEAIPDVIQLFQHIDELVRRTAYRVAGELKSKEALVELKNIYPGEGYLNQLEILKTFRKVPDEQHLGFLREVLDEEDDVELQIQSTKAMENTGEPGISLLVKLMKSKSGYKNYKILIRHVLDGRIN